MAPVEGEYWFRYVDFLTAPPLDEWESPCGQPSVNVVLCKYLVARVTPKGVWLKGIDDRQRFVLAAARKRFACPTKEEALESFLARKKSQLRIYATKINNVNTAIALATNDPLFVHGHLLNSGVEL